MQYKIENRLDVFEFHDSVLTLICLDENALVLSAKHLNIHKNISENPHDEDMEIDIARMVFREFEVLSFEPMRSYHIDDDGNWYTEDPQIIFEGAEARTRFLSELQKGITINCFEICQKGCKTEMEISTCGPSYFFATMAFEGVSVEWDGYCQKAWYELHKQYSGKITLMTPDGETETKIRIICHEEDMYNSEGQLEEAPIVTAGVQYEGKEYWGQGKEYTCEDVFADLQKKLPDGVFLKCCLTCRHGNICPYGNELGKLFCTKGIEVRSKGDMCDLFDHRETSGIYARMKDVEDNCGDYQPQSKDAYNYNDFLYYLHK